MKSRYEATIKGTVVEPSGSSKVEVEVKASDLAQVLYANPGFFAETIGAMLNRFGNPTNSGHEFGAALVENDVHPTIQRLEVIWLVSAVEGMALAANYVDPRNHAAIMSLKHFAAAVPGLEFGSFI